ncbi:acyl-CoA thioesterase [Aliifodinibius sp. S!AR15-10]|uniref:acyl-CoA thioesterase n=1 Tax=Aliifodinibius sp. S!AR15-10 TaxID=2950437 RepID=UPI00285DACD1|nr:thioesterase family protein [Aliifodinibius sp. S!AR15-10]MDR8390365.1 acyl-CoA thioesterase [Aliifodinibius sp. S!AR15-10]
MIRPEYVPDLFPHWSTIPIRFRDLDPLNHVNNAIFSTYYEEARIDFIRQVPVLKQQIRSEYSFVLVNLHIDFIKPAEYPGELLVGSGIKSIGNTSITSFQAIFHSGSKALVSVAEASGVWFNLEKQRPSRIPHFEGQDKFILDATLFE